MKSKVATIEFKKKFPITSKDPVLYVSEYATAVASHLPFLPDGVDPEDTIVRFIVERLIQENPGNAGWVMVARRADREAQGEGAQQCWHAPQSYRWLAASRLG
jgi:hypothetical protein